MDDKERVLTLASASRMTGVEQKKLQSMIDEGRLEAVKTEAVSYTHLTLPTKA